MFPILLSVLLVLWLPFEVIAIKSSMYKGTLNTTVYGMTCQHWNSDSPHVHHDYNKLPENYCRDPDASNYLWCYTTNPKVRWDICDPRELYEVRPYKSILSNTTGSVCKKAVCCNLTWSSFRSVNRKCDARMFVKLLINYLIAIKSTMYNGTLNTTVFGKPCQQWKSDSPHAHDYNNLPENYCRDPDASNFLWCYTTDPQVRWDICDPRVLTEVPPYKSILSNTTGSACIKEVCCNLTWKSFKNVEKECDPRMFVQLLIVHPSAYIGCFKDTNDRGLPKNVKDVKSANECKEECKDQGYLYAGVQYGRECFCGNQYGRYGKTDNCDMKCSNRVDICGGIWANSIYKTDLQTKPTAEFVERYVVAPYFTFILDINVGKEDCAAQCRKKSGCDGFFYSGGNRCRLGKLNSPDAIKTLTLI